MGDAERELMRIYRSRLNDYRQTRGRRKKQAALLPERFSMLINRYFKDNREVLKKITLSRALSAWKGFVGEAAAKVSSAERIRGKQLIVRVGDPLWMHQLYLLKNDLIKKYRKEFPTLDIQDIFYAPPR